MEFILIHKMREPDRYSRKPEEWLKAIEAFRKILAKPEETVAGGKLVASYTALVENWMFCIWDVPNYEALVPFAQQMFMLGFDNDIILVEPTKVHIEKAAKFAEAMKKK